MRSLKCLCVFLITILVGAHITVMYSDEIKKYGVERIQECGETIYFIPKECQIVHPPKWQEIDEVYFVVVEAPELDRIREKYRLPKRKYEFHITIGVKPHGVKLKKNVSEEDIEVD